jgi:hypothetical protein
MPGRLLDRWAPGFDALRDRRPLFVVAPVALGVLAGKCITAVAGVSRRRGAVAGIVAAIALAATAVRANLAPCRLMALPTGEEVPAIYRDLARRERGPVVEIPVAATLKEVPSATQQAWYEYYSIFHWQPLVNGYSSVWPVGLEAVMAMARALPAPRALENLVECTGVRWIVVHAARTSPEERDAFLAPVPGLRLAARFGDDLLFEVAPARRAGDCVTSLRARDAAATIEGTPLARLAPDARRVAIESVTLPAELTRPQYPAAVAVPVRLRNVGSSTWPAVALDETYLVRVSYAWLDAAGAPVPVPGRQRLWTRLPVDPQPGEVVELPVAVRLPPNPGRYRLEIVVRQGLQGLFEASGSASAPSPVVVN